MEAVKSLISKLQNRSLLHQAKQCKFAVGSDRFAPFFIVSAGRSGTTLLRRMLTVNDTIHIPPESDDLLPKCAQHFVLNNKKGWEYLVEKTLIDFEKSSCFKFWEIELMELKERLIALPANDRSYAKIVDTIYWYHASHQGKNASLWGDKTPYLMYCLDWMKLIFPAAQYIHVIRDGRAVVHSMMSKQNYTLEKAAMRWKDSIQLFDKHLARLDAKNFLQIRYEDLIQDPKKTLLEVCKLLNVSFMEGMIDKIPQEMGDTVLPHHQNVSRPLTKDLINDWKTGLTQKDLSYLNKVFSKELAALKYNS